MNANRTKYRNLLGWVGALLVLPLASLPIYGQASADEEDDVFQLSPFTVQASEEGYLATETLAGTRLKTDVRNLGASISLVTEELMNDLGANNLEELLPYIGNTEVGGIFGNMSGEGSVNFFGQNVPTTALRQRPQMQTRVRGLTSADLTRDYFLSDLPIDGYNVERVAIQRGANAMLFGLGSPAGLINTQLISARFNDTNKVELRTDDYGTLRAVLDVNRVLFEDKLAARFAFLYEDQEYVQEPTYEEDRRAYATFTYKPFRNTKLKVNLESGRIESSRPDPIGPVNHMHKDWFDAGMPLADTARYANYNSAPAFPFGNGGPFNGNAGNGIAVVYAGSNAEEPNTQLNGLGIDRARPPSQIDDIGADPIGPWRFLSSGTYRGQQFGGGGITNHPTATSRAEEQGFLDFTNFNFEKLKLMAAERAEEDFESYSFILEQLFLRDVTGMNAGIELSFYKEDYDSKLDDGQWDNISSSIQIDVNPYLADGTPNPNVGRPFTFNVNPQEQLDLFEQEATRLTGFYEIDFTQTDAADWLGKHTLSATFNQQESYEYHHEAPWNSSPATRSGDEAGAFVRAVGDIGSFNAHPARLSYIGSSVLNATSYDQIKIKDVSNPTLFEEGQTYTYRVWDRQTQQWMNLSGNLIGPGRPRKANIALNENDSLAAILHSEFLKGDLITTVGWREDEVDLSTYITQRDEFNLVDVDSLDTLTPIGTVKEDIFSYGAVYRFPFGIPEGMDLRFHYSESENFAPAPGRTDAAGRPLGQPSGETKEYGFRFSFMEEKISIKFNWYETNLASANASTPIGNNERIGEQMIFERASSYLNRAEFESEQGNAGLSDELVEIAEKFIAIAPQSLKDVYGFQRVDRFSINYSDPANSNQVADIQSEGMEIELWAQPNPQWNIGFNASRQEVAQTNIAPHFIAFFEELTPKWQPLFDLPANGADYAEGTIDPVTVKDLFDQRSSWVEQTKRMEGLSNPEIREWRWNAFTNYSFADDSRFKGFGIGGALRWQDDVTIGYQSEEFTNDLGDTILIADLDTPILGPSLLQGDVWLSYQTTLRENINWKIQLNVRNALRDKDVVPVRAQPDSPFTDVAQVRVTQPETFILTSTFEF